MWPLGRQDRPQEGQDGRKEPRATSIPTSYHPPPPESTAMMDFPKESKLYLEGLLEKWEGNIW